MPATVGQPAPDFDLASQTGERVSLAALRDKVVVVYFYPKDNTPGCTRESCAFRDSYEDFVDAGAEVIGISSDSVSSHEGFAARYRLPFKLLADPKGEVRKRWGVPKSLGVMPGRVTYVVDQAGVVRHSFNSQLNVLKHVRDALDVVRSLAEKG